MCALLLTLVSSIPVAAQDSDVERDGNRVTVSVAVADGPPRPGPANPAASRDWPYTCKWYETPTPDQVGAVALRPTAGALYVLICDPRPGSGRAPINQFVFYDPADPVPGEPGVVTSFTLADFARASLQPQPLGIATSPDGEQITGVETWFWPAGSTDTQSVSASAGGLTVTVEARFVRTTFITGEPGAAVLRCTDFLEWTSGATDSPCSHTYLTEERGRVVQAETVWEFVWYDNAGQPTPAFYGTAVIVETDLLDVIDLESVITRGR